MKVNFNQPILNYDGEQVKQPFYEVDKEDASKYIVSKEILLTLGYVCREALNFVDKDIKENPEQLIKKGFIIVKINKALANREDIELESDEISLIKEQCKNYTQKGNNTPFVLIQITSLLEGKDNPIL